MTTDDPSPGFCDLCYSSKERVLHVTTTPYSDGQPADVQICEECVQALAFKFAGLVK